jgi:protoheme IX farnesyltransferase
MTSKRLASVQTISAPPRIWEPGWLSRFQLANFVQLSKPRVTVLVLITTAVGFYLGSADSMNFRLLLHTLIGTALAAGGAAALNQFLERASDKKMRRTENRPLPAGRLQPSSALVFGIALALAGTIYLAAAVNLLAAFLAFAIVTTYLFLYTPLKQKTSLCTLVGAFPGAAPPLIGWAGAAGALGAKAWSLFFIMFLWQFPHFLAIAWMYRDDYERGGCRMLPLQDRQGFITGQQIVIYAMALIPVSLLPSFLGITGLIYLFGAVGLGLLFLHFGFRVAQSRSTSDARKLLKASVMYLPLLLALMVADKV